MEERLEGQEYVALELIDLEKHITQFREECNDNVEEDWCPRGRGRDGGRDVRLFSARCYTQTTWP